MKQENAERIAAIVWGDRNRPTLSWLGRQFERADDVITRKDNLVGLRYTRRVIEKELKAGGFSDQAVKQIHDCLLQQSRAVFEAFGARIVIKVPPVTVAEIWGRSNSKLYHQYDYSAPADWRAQYFTTMRKFFTDALAQQDIAFPEKGIEKGMIAPAMSVRQKFTKVAACLAPGVIGGGLASLMLMQPSTQTTPEGQLAEAFLKIAGGLALAMPSILWTMFGGLQKAVPTARAVAPVHNMPNEHKMDHYF